MRSGSARSGAARARAEGDVAKPRGEVSLSSLTRVEIAVNDKECELGAVEKAWRTGD